MGDIGKKIDISEFKFQGYIIDGERYQIKNSDKFFYHLFIYDPEVSLTKEKGVIGITAKNVTEMKKELEKHIHY